MTRIGTAWTYRAAGATDAIRILKPHGSVNLAHVMPSTSGVPDQVLDVELRVENMGYHSGLWPKKWFLQNLVVGLRPKTEHTGCEQSDILRAHFQRILNACASAFAGAQEAWVVGYSFPSADTSFSDAVACGLAGGRRCPVHIITREDEDTEKMLQRVRNLFGADALVEEERSGFIEWARQP